MVDVGDYAKVANAFLVMHKLQNSADLFEPWHCPCLALETFTERKALIKFITKKETTLSIDLL